MPGQILSYAQAPEVRWLGVGPFTQTFVTGGEQPAEIGAWAELFFTASGKITVHPTSDGTGAGDALFATMLGLSPLCIAGIVSQGGDDAIAKTSPATVTVVAQDPPGGSHTKTLVFEVALVGATGDAVFAPDNTPVFITIFGIPA